MVASLEIAIFGCFDMVYWKKGIFFSLINDIIRIMFK